MAFRASNIIPEAGYRQARQVALNVKGFASTTSLQMQSATNADRVLQTYHLLRQYRDELNSFRTVQGIGQYAQDQESDANYDVAAEFNALVVAIQNVMDAIQAAFPVDANGYLLEKKLVGETYEYRQFSPASLASLRALLDTLAASIS